MFQVKKIYAPKLDILLYEFDKLKYVGTFNNYIPRFTRHVK